MPESKLFPGPKLNLIRSYAVSVLSVAVALILCKWPPLHLEESPLALFVFAVLISAWLGGVAPGLLATTLSALAFDYYFLAPLHSLAAKPTEIPRFIGFVGSLLIVGLLTSMERSAAESLRRARDNLKVTVQELQSTNEALQAESRERKSAEESLRRSESYLAEAQRLSHTGSWASIPAIGEIKYFSEECYRLTGFDPHGEQPRYEMFFQRVHPEDQARLSEAVETAGRENRDFELDYRIVHPGGEIRILHVLGHPVPSATGGFVEYVGTVIDITERKRAELLLAGENQLLEMIARGDSLPLILDAVCQLVEELLTGSLSSILLLDPSANRLRHGAAPSLPSRYTEAIDGLAPGPRAGSCGTAAYRAEPVIVSDIATDRLWGDYRHLALPHGLRACWSAPILTSAGKVLGTFAIYYREPRSPTALDHNFMGQIVHIASIAIERKQADEALEALRQAQADLAHVNRVTTMGELTASVAHEVNQPIAAAVTNARTCLRWLTRDQPDLEEARAAAMRIVNDGTRAAEIIKRIRLLFKKGTSERELVDVTEVIREMIVLLRGEAMRCSISMRTELEVDTPRVMADRVQLQQVLMNLMLNAIEAMKDADAARELNIKSQRAENDHVLVCVSDTGLGLPLQQADQLFNAFFTTKPDGTGLGLSISRSIVESHGGRLWAANNPQRGATFCFTLPTEAEPKE